MGTRCYLIRGQKKRNWFGPKFDEIISRNRENDMQKHFKARQWIRMLQEMRVVCQHVRWFIEPQMPFSSATK